MGRGRPKKIWAESTKKDLAFTGLTQEMVLTRAQWLYLNHIADLAFWERLLVVLILV